MAPPPPEASAHPFLVLDGAFDSLEEVDAALISGNVALTRLSFLDALLANGAPPPSALSIHHNPMLPEAEVITQIEALGGPTTGVCGNRDSVVPEDQCTCPVGE